MANIEPLIAGKRSLVLDDEFLIALDIQHILESAGAAGVTSVADGPAALALIKSGTKIDFAVLDIKLSGAMRNSLGIASVLTDKRIPFIFITGMGSEDVRIERFSDAPIVEKPYEASILLDAILRVLGSR